MDFCSEPLCSIIRTEKPFLDGYEPEVLALKNNVPFRCEAFIRAPLDIQIEFIVPIDISRIVIGPEVNEKYASGFKITTHYTSISNINIANENRRNSMPGSSSILKPLKNLLSRAPSLSHLVVNNSENSQFAGKWFTSQQKIVVLKNRQYKHFLNVPMPTESKGLHVYEGSLKHQDKFSLRNVHAITLTILRVIPTGSPALRFLEIWGQPAVGVELNTKISLISSWNQFQDKRRTILCKPQVFYNSIPENKEESTISTVNKEIDIVGTGLKMDFEIPDDFLDPLTCELMTIPLLLPSGNNIDSQSLDRFIAHEALWGRKPSDPFTGVPFKQLFSPVPNVHLKCRIDRFLLLNKVEGCGRTLSTGNAETPYNGRSRLLGKRKSVQSEPSVNKVKRTAEMLSPIIQQPFPIKNKIVLPKSNSIKPDENPRREVKGHGLIQRLNSSFRQTSRSNRVLVKPLSATTDKIPELTNKFCDVKPLSATSGTILSPRSSALSLFKNTLSRCSCSNDGLYRLMCSHSLCQKCIVLYRQPHGIVECPQCAVASQSSDIYRQHPGSIFRF